MKLARTTTAIAAAALFTLVPLAAQADNLVHTDAIGDVQAATVDENGDPTSDPVTVPDRTIGDITKVRTEHNATNVRVEMYFRALPKAGSINDHEFRFVTNELERDVSIVAGTGHWAGVATMYKMDGNEYPCKTLRFFIDYPNKRVIVNVPRSCLSYPKFVKFGAGFAAISGNKIWIDDSRTTAGNGDDLALSPGVFR